VSYVCSVAKPIMNVEHELKFGEERRNIVLTCDIKYAYPTPVIKWSITTPLSGQYTMQNGSSDHKLLGNGSIEIYHRFLSEKKHVIALCLATNMHGSSKKKFHLWEHKIFTKGIASYKFRKFFNFFFF